MNCQQAKLLIEPYADGELDAAAILELEEHIHDCSACALEWRNAQALKKALKQDALYFTAPKELRRKVKAELYSQFATKSRWNFWNWNWLTATTTSVATACLALLLIVTLTRPSAQQQLTQEIVSSHIRSLMASHIMDVASTDQHTVKPWFAGKLDFSPPVKDLAAQGFSLIGGRLDYLGGRSVAALVYQHNKHFINVFIWPVANAGASEQESYHGYNIVSFDAGGFQYYLVSDMDEPGLTQLAGLLGQGK
jgi:anti-sigma factor RsiW